MQISLPKRFRYFGGNVFADVHKKSGEDEELHMEIFQRNPVQMAPRNRRFLSLVMVKRVLMKADHRDLGKFVFNCFDPLGRSSRQ